MEAAMKAFAAALLINAVAISVAGAQSAHLDGTATERKATHKTIRFDDIAPKGMVLLQCWNAIGIDGHELIYIGFTARRAD
jgi:hypothetical protein